jgi:tetratricopeptide (TPR) repeat protein
VSGRTFARALRAPALAVVLLGGLLGGAGPAAAEDPDFWASVRTPELPRYRRELRAGLQLLDDTELDDELDPERRDVLRRGAAVHFERAVAIAPDRMEAYYFLGSVLYSLADDAGAVAAFERARAITPDSPFEADIAFKLGVSHTRQQRFAEAVVEYDRALSFALDERRPQSLSLRSVALSNRAEVLMGLARLEEAVTSYRMAFDADDRNAGALWGMAVALDRDEQVGPARETAARAAQVDPDRTGIVGPDVFFVPPHEKHYYLGMAFEAAGDDDAALAEWQAFLLVAGSEGRWSLQARRHIQELGRRGRSGAPGRRRP